MIPWLQVLITKSRWAPPLIYYYFKLTSFRTNAYRHFLCYNITSRYVIILICLMCTNIINQRVVQQTDTYSCGPIVIKHARLRMMGLATTFQADGNYDADALQSEYITLLNNAWVSGALCEVSVPVPKKRKHPAKSSMPNKRPKSLWIANRTVNWRIEGCRCDLLGEAVG